MDWAQVLLTCDGTADELLTKLLKSHRNLAAKQIALFLRTNGFVGITEQEVIRRANELHIHLKGRNTAASKQEISRRIKKEKKPEQKPVQADSATPLVEQIKDNSLRLPDGELVTLETLTDSMCHFPIGEPSAKDFHYCGRSVHSCRHRVYHYCEAHIRKVYDPPKSNRQRDYVAVDERLRGQIRR